MVGLPHREKCRQMRHSQNTGEAALSSNSHKVNQPAFELEQHVPGIADEVTRSQPRAPSRRECSLATILSAARPEVHTVTFPETGLFSLQCGISFSVASDIKFQGQRFSLSSAPCPALEHICCPVQRPGSTALPQPSLRRLEAFYP